MKQLRAKLARFGQAIHYENLLITQRSAGGAINHGLRYAARQRADPRVAKKNAGSRNGKFVMAQLVVRKNFRQSHIEKLPEKQKRQSGIKSALPLVEQAAQAMAWSSLAFKSRLLLAPTIWSRIWPFLMTSNMGMEVTRNWAARP